MNLLWLYEHRCLFRVKGIGPADGPCKEPLDECHCSYTRVGILSSWMENRRIPMSTARTFK